MDGHDPKCATFRALPTGQDMTGGLTETSDDGAGGWVRGGDYYANMGR